MVFKQAVLQVLILRNTSRYVTQLKEKALKETQLKETSRQNGLAPKDGGKIAAKWRQNGADGIKMIFGYASKRV